ncbi:hypothetical protein BN2476_230370 [Paraburkholderia piptadeniae]|uniref:Uncharacterized protein n=1 Tax=Paraburkholderia piptadeniae TaxID=1701573 RepID=A0A1N7RZB6_9BURK|nr:hypothetical protein BN2476_230370 [Paraburkholderia piptadeniae]
MKYACLLAKAFTLLFTFKIETGVKDVYIMVVYHERHYPISAPQLPPCLHSCECERFLRTNARLRPGVFSSTSSCSVKSLQLGPR